MVETAQQRMDVDRKQAAQSPSRGSEPGRVLSVRSTGKLRSGRTGRPPSNKSPINKKAMSDQLIIEFDKGLRTLFAPAPPVRSLPGAKLPEAEMSDAARSRAAALMRVNHCGEIC